MDERENTQDKGQVQEKPAGEVEGSKLNLTTHNEGVDENKPMMTPMLDLPVES